MRRRQVVLNVFVNYDSLTGDNSACQKRETISDLNNGYFLRKFTQEVMPTLFKT